MASAMSPIGPPKTAQPLSPWRAGTFFRMVVGNALALSALYLALGVAVELLRGHAPSTTVLRFSYALDALPARILEKLGLLIPLREAYTDGRLSEPVVRLIFGSTAVLFVFLLALLIGSATTVTRHWISRLRARA